MIGKWPLKSLSLKLDLPCDLVTLWAEASYTQPAYKLLSFSSLPSSSLLQILEYLTRQSTQSAATKWGFVCHSSADPFPVSVVAPFCFFFCFLAPALLLQVGIFLLLFRLIFSKFGVFLVVSFFSLLGLVSGMDSSHFHESCFFGWWSTDGWGVFGRFGKFFPWIS